MNDNAIFNALEHGLGQAGAVQNPADVHGTLCGMLCMDNDADPARALDDEPTEALTQALSALREMTLEGLFDPDLSFTPLLPGDDAEIETRVQALARWCAGFLYGLGSQSSGESGDDSDFDLSRLSDEVREVVRDLTELSRAGLTAEDSDNETAEADYAELVEYVRVGVQMIFLELQPRREGPETREQLH